METTEENVQKLGELIKDIKMAMLTTVDEDGSLRSRPMATQRTKFDGALWFFTRASAPKVDEVEHEHEVNVSYADADSNTFVSVSGTAELVRDQTKIKELWTPALKAWFPNGSDDPEVALLKIDVEKAEYWDSPHGKVVQLIGYVKAVATGHSYQPGPAEHDKIRL